MNYECVFCLKQFEPCGKQYCSQRCRNYVHRAISRQLHPSLAASRHLRSILFEFGEYLPDRLYRLKALDSLDERDLVHVQWLESTFNRLAAHVGGREKAKHLIINYGEVYRAYFEGQRDEDNLRPGRSA
jgi:hypothetical protein